MLFDHAGAERRGGDGDVDSQGVIGVAHPQTERRAKGLHRAQIHVVERRRILARAVKERDAFAQYRPAFLGFEGGTKLGGTHRAAASTASASFTSSRLLIPVDRVMFLPAGSDLQQEGRVRDLAGRDLDRLDVQLVDEQAQARRIERRRHERNSAGLAMIQDLPVIGCAELSFRTISSGSLSGRTWFALVVGLARAGGDDVAGTARSGT